jgi:hypothetical protein
MFDNVLPRIRDEETIPNARLEAFKFERPEAFPVNN